MLSYEDSAGNVHTDTKDFYADVTSMGNEGMEEGMIEDPQTGEMIPVDQGMEENMDAGGSLLTSPFLWIGLIIILALVGLLIRKRKKDKKNEELIIDDEDI